MKLTFLFILLFVLSSCSRKTDIDLFRGAKTAEGQKNFTKATTLYEEIVDRFPSKAYAESSLIRLSIIYNSELSDQTKARQSSERYFSMFLSKRTHPEDLFLYGSFLEGVHDFQYAATQFEKIIAQFPNQSYAESSFIRLAIIYNNDIKDARKALHAYQRCYTMFPSGKHAATMLFLSGFIYNNELHHLDSARMVYESFLQKYPDHELAPSAKFELENLGKDPGQTLTPSADAGKVSKSKPSKKAAKK